MRDLTFYETVDEYRDTVRARFNPMFLENAFYSNLIDLVVDTRAPIFYTISHPSEHFAFSGAYQFETERERYPNAFRRNLFWLHDFTHMLFPYAHDVYAVSEKDFLSDFIYQERIASTETEVFAYYRIPELREKVFQDEKLYYDVMRERGTWGHAGSGRIWEPQSAEVKPTAGQFLPHRNLLVTDDKYGEIELGEYPVILKFFQQWRRLTPKWVGERYKSMVGVRVPEPERYVEWQGVYTYEEAIEQYKWSGTQENYEQTTLDNLRRAYAMLRWDNPPTRWRHVPEALQSLEGAVFFQ